MTVVCMTCEMHNVHASATGVVNPSRESVRVRDQPDSRTEAVAVTACQEGIDLFMLDLHKHRQAVRRPATYEHWSGLIHFDLQQQTLTRPIAPQLELSRDLASPPPYMQFRFL